jgi:hypothetical protein
MKDILKSGNNPMFNKTIITLLVIVTTLLLIQSCATYYFRSIYKETNKLIHASNNLETKPFLKAHFKNGDICTLKDSWQIDSIGGYITGVGWKYDFNRQLVYEGEIKIPIDRRILL